MNIAAAPAPGSPFRRAIDVSTVPDYFLPGEGRASRSIVPPTQPQASADEPLSSEDFENTREAVRLAEERLAKIREEEEALSARRSRYLAFQKEVEDFQLDISATLEKITRLEDELGDGVSESRRSAASIHRTIQVLQGQLSKIQNVTPDEWPKARMQSEMDHALDLLSEVEETTKSEMARLTEDLPRRMMPVRNNFWDKALHGVGSTLAFLLPLIAFIAIAVILLLTALSSV